MCKNRERYPDPIQGNRIAMNNCVGNKRLIDADVLDEEVRNFFLAITGEPKQATVVRECKESFRRIIDEQPTVYVSDGWIPVEERLPEDDSHKDTCISENLFVIAWMPLPDPYRTN